MATSVLCTAGMVASASAAMVMPDFANVPTGWVTDRYDPHTFANVGVFQGKSDVLEIEINRAEGLSARPGGFQNIFYNTQGRQHTLAGAGVGSVLAASLYIESSWLDAANGHVRTDMWGVLSDAVPAVTDYPIIGFTNYGGAARYRVWDGAVWVDLNTPVVASQWVDFEMELTAGSIVYSIDGNVVYTDNTIGGDHFSAVIMQAYNFFDPALGAIAENYAVHWADADADVVPEPATLALLAGALLAGGIARRRRR